MAGDQDNDGSINYPLPFIASQLGCPMKTLQEVLDVLIRTKRITINGNKIIIINWFKYQSLSTVTKKEKKEKKEKKSSFTEATLEGEKVELTQIDPDTFEDESTTIKVKGQHPDGSLILDIQPR